METLHILTSEKRILAGFGLYFTSKRANINVLSFAEVEENCQIELLWNVRFRVHVENQQLDFVKKG